jgi:hypothetical protein
VAADDRRNGRFLLAEEIIIIDLRSLAQALSLERSHTDPSFK